MSTHLAAIATSKGQPLEVQARPTPKPGPGELLVAIKSVALNPADGIIRDTGLLIPSYPTILGYDFSGLVLEIGDGVPSKDIPDDQGVYFEPGITRVAGYPASYREGFNLDYGGFQERCIIPWQHVVPLPQNDLSWNYAATLPVAAKVALSAWDTLEIPRLKKITAPASIMPSEQKTKKLGEALLIWGASSSVGTMGVQSARMLKEDPSSSIAAVYATAGPANWDYISSLGADRIFDYKDAGVVDAIVSAAKEDGVIIRNCYLAIGALQSCQAVLKAFLADDKEGVAKAAKIGSAPIVPPDADVVSGIEVIFLDESENKEERLEQIRYWLGTWCRESLIKGAIKPSPEPKVVGKGLGAINAAIDMVLKGVSCTKLVVEIDD